MTVIIFLFGTLDIGLVGLTAALTHSKHIMHDFLLLEPVKEFLTGILESSVVRAKSSSIVAAYLPPRARLGESIGCTLGKESIHWLLVVTSPVSPLTDLITGHVCSTTKRAAVGELAVLHSF